VNKQIIIDNHIISKESPVFIVAEMSGNHLQDYGRAVEILHVAKEAGADCIKLQTYTADSLSLDCDKEWFLEKDSIWDGIRSYDLYKEAYTPWEWQPKLMEEAKKLGLVCFSSPFDDDSIEFMTKMQMPAYKVASYEINDIPLIRKIARMQKPVILATGVAYEEDIERALQTCRDEGNNQVMLLKCVSAYPTPYEDVNLNMIPTLARKYDCMVGLSDHTMGGAVAVASVALGARMVEKHLTLKRSDGGPDSAFSMEPKEFAEMVKQIRMVEKALGKSEYFLTEKQKREHEGSRSLFVVKDVKRGEIFTPENVRSIRPGIGIHTMHYEEVMGKTAVHDIERGMPLQWTMIK